MVSIKGTNGDDTLQIPSGYDITQVSVNGGGGYDTLDLSNYKAPGATTSGVFVSLGASGETAYDSFVGDGSFTGIPGTTNALTTADTIRSIESLIGTSGNDSLSMSVRGINAHIDGGAGNDYLEVSNAANATLIGGSGSDWLCTYVTNSTLIGGWLDASGVAHEDAAGTAVDTFEIGALSNVNIQDFQAGTDRLLFDHAFTGGTWSVVGTNTWALMVNGVARATLYNVVDPSHITWGFEYSSGSNGTFSGSSGNDVLNCNNAYSENVLTGPGTGNDVVVSFDKLHDSLTFTSDTQVTWSNTYVNGERSLLGAFAGGSVTVEGLTTADVSSGALHIQGLVTPATIDTVSHMSWWSLPSDAPLI